ncbi:PKD domain-containing protein [Kangiella marina]|uniref:PKD domain-containing protein n=1 Tax=Kangiella marina TaxID=1079178 RepID=A0ABP8IJX2_9GAMM
MFDIMKRLLAISALVFVMSACSDSDSNDDDNSNNQKPVAEAGSDQEVDVGAEVTLSGEASSDPDGDTLTYQWTLSSTPSGSTAVLVAATSMSPTFTADVAGSYTAELVVSDGVLSSDVDSVTIVAVSANQKPEANAGPDQDVRTGSTVNLDGSGSVDADGDTLTYQWEITSKPSASTATLSDNDVEQPTFIADVDGTYTVDLVVNDGTIDSDVDSVTIIAASTNAKPVSNAGNDQAAKTSSSVMLDGSASTDLDGDQLSYQWTLTAKPAASAAVLNDSTAARPTFDADVDGEYTAELVVNDGSVSSDVDAVTVVAASLNSEPVANAGDDLKVKANTVVTLNGTLSSDADKDLVNYQWALTSTPAGSAAELSNISLATPTFVADVEGTYEAELTVNDGSVDSSVDTVTVVAVEANAAPIANAGLEQSVNTGANVSLDGSASVDVDGDPLNYEWAIISAPAMSTAALDSSSSVSPSFTADVEGTYTAQLIVNDGSVKSEADTVTVVAASTNAKPVANAGLDVRVTAGTEVSLDGSGSFDADGDTLTYQWSFISQPNGSAAAFSNATAETTSFTANAEGSYVVALVVDDGTEASVEDIVHVEVIQPQVTLRKQFGADASATYNQVTMPYTSSATVDASVSGSADFTLDTFRILAEGQNYTITNVQVTDDSGNVSPYFTVISDSYVLLEGEAVEFALMSPLTAGIETNLTFSFEIAETGQTFEANYTFTSN